MAADGPVQQKSFQYPYATAPDIIRSAEKDKYLQGILTQHLSNVLRRLYGSRHLQVHSSGLNSVTELLYLCSTTLIGNRTLGEEYCDIVQVQDKQFTMPSLLRRSGFIVSSILLPYSAGKLLPRFRNLLERRLSRESNGATHEQSPQRQKVREYLLANLNAITSPSWIYVISLATFYFTGSYYHPSKRLFGLKYIFTRSSESTADQISYEVLGALLTIQIAVQGWIHIRGIMNTNQESITRPYKTEAYTAETLVAVTHTPQSDGPRYVLSNETTLGWIQGEQQRKCTLCLEELKDPSATTCGHVFCWKCITDWIREKPECPLCRQNIQTQHVLPLRD